MNFGKWKLGTRLSLRAVLSASMAIIAIESSPSLAQQADTSEVLVQMCSNGSGIGVPSDREAIEARLRGAAASGVAVDEATSRSIMQSCALYNRAWQNGFDAGTPTERTAEYQRICAKLVQQKIAGRSRAVEDYVKDSGISTLQSVPFLIYCGAYEQGVLDGLKAAREMLSK